LAPLTLITILAITLLFAALALWRLPVATCAECPHCQLQKLAKERESEELIGRYYGIPQCGVCGRYHAREEPHRR
jgi:hypothetical protein